MARIGKDDVEKRISSLAGVIASALLLLAAARAPQEPVDSDRVTFRVLDADGRPIAGAHLISSGFWSEGGGEWDAFSEADGRFAVPRIVGQISHAHGILVSAEGFAPRMVLPPTGDGMPDVVLETGRTVRGTVRGSRGPLAGATVALFPWRWWRGAFPSDSPCRTRTAADGSYVLEHLPDDRIRLVATAVGYSVKSVSVTAGGTADFILRQVPTVTGQVVDGVTGSPLAEVSIGGVGASDRDGRFVANADGWDEYGGAGISFLRPGYIEATAYSTFSGEQTLCIALYPEATLRGTVVDPGDRGIDHATIDVIAEASEVEGAHPFTPSVQTKRDGGFTARIPAAVPVSIVVSTEHARWREFHLGVAAPGRTITRELVIVPGVDVRGRITDRATGSPIGAVSVGCDRSWSRVNTDGTFTIPALEPGTHWLIARDPGYGTHVQRLDVSDGPPAEVNLALERESIVAGTVVDLQGVAVAGAAVIIERAGLPSRARAAMGTTCAATGRDGTFRCDQLEAVPLEIVIRPPREREQELGMLNLSVSPPFDHLTCVLPRR